MTIANYLSLAAVIISAVMMFVNTINIRNNHNRAEQNEKKEDEQKAKEEAAQQTSLMLALDNIKNSLNRIENEINTVRQDTRENHDQLIELKQSFKSEHRRLDQHEQRLNAIEEALRELARERKE